jgi:hypothetical protein
MLVLYQTYLKSLISMYESIELQFKVQIVGGTPPILKPTSLGCSTFREGSTYRRGNLISAAYLSTSKVHESRLQYSADVWVAESWLQSGSEELGADTVETPSLVGSAENIPTDEVNPTMGLALYRNEHIQLCICFLRQIKHRSITA